MIYIVENCPTFYLKCERILEEACIKYYFENENPYQAPVDIPGYDLFTQYMSFINFHNTPIVTKHGHIIRFWSNSVWIVVEAHTNFEAVQKAHDIFHDDLVEELRYYEKRYTSNSRLYTVRRNILQ